MERKSRRRRRPALSCLECRRRKIKCDRNDPCAHCIAAKTKCAFRIYRDEASAQTQAQQARNSPRRSLPDPPAHVPTPPSYTGHSRTEMSSMEQPNSPFGFWTAAAEASAATERGNGPNTPESHNIQQSHPSGDAESTLWNLMGRLRHLEATPTSDSIRERGSDTTREIGALQSGLQGAHVVFNKTRMVRYSHWQGVSKEV